MFNKFSSSAPEVVQASAETIGDKNSTTEALREDFKVMEEIKRKTEFNNISLQLQALDKLYHEVRQKRPGGKLLTASTPEYVELKNLWQYTCVEDDNVARHACQLWTKLLQNNEADFTYVMNGFLNQVPNAKNLHGIVEGVSDLLELQIVLKTDAGGAYSCPYSIRNPPHPFITILMNRPDDSWPLLLDQVSTLISHNNKSISQNALSCLDPFLKFILLDPKGNQQYATIRGLLKTTLVGSLSQMEDRNSASTCFEYLLQLMSQMQMSTKDKIAESTHFCIQLLATCKALMSNIDDVSGERLGLLAIDLILKNHQYRLGVTSLYQMILDVAKAKPQIFGNACNLVVLGDLALRSYSTDLVYLLNIVKICLSISSETSPIPGFLYTSVINLVAAPISKYVPYQKTLASISAEIINLLQNRKTCKFESQEKVNNPDEDSSVYSLLSAEVYTAQAVARLTRVLTVNTRHLKQWLTNLQTTLKKMTSISYNLTNLLVCLLIRQNDTEICKLVIDRLVDIAKQQPSQAVLFLPVFLYCLNIKTCPALKLSIMEAIPKLATHKYCVPTVLKVIQSLGLNIKLTSLSIRLLTDLWKIQNRCFPMLMSAITENHGNSVTMATVADEIMIAKALAIKEICRLKPEQHGSEVLSPLSDILDNSTEEKGGTAAALCLESLYFICQAEVIDIVSTCKVLENKLLTETRPIVIERICDLLSLLPQLQASSKAYEEFLVETVRRLWLFTQVDNPKVVAAAFCALSSFRVEHFKLSHLKYKIVEEFVLQAQAIIEQQDEDGKSSVDTLIPTPPGVCYIRLLQDQNKYTMKGFQEFLSSLVGKEFGNLPRGIYYSATHKHGTSARLGKAVASIPSLIQTQYENTNQPGLRPELAAGLLFCYDPPIAVSRDGRPRLHYVMSHGKNYQAMFQSLLNDVSIPPTDWHMMASIPKAWSLFVERLFGSMVLARKAEIDVQKNRDFIDEKEAEDKKMSAWLWARDSLTETIKKASKGNPAVQANAILALAGLISASQRYVMSLDKEECQRLDDITDHMTHSHWTMTVIDSCLSIIDCTYKPKSSLIGLCQQRSEDDRLPASILAQTAGILAISQLVPVLMGQYVENIYMVLDKLIKWLPGQPDDDECPPVLHLSRGMATGKFMASLVSESFPDVEGSKGSLALMKALDALERCCLSHSAHRSGAVLGLGFCFSALCQDGKTDSRVHVVSTLNKLFDHLLTVSSTEDIFQVYGYSVAMVTSSSFMSNIVEIDLVNKILKHLLDIVQRDTKNPNLALSLGLLMYNLINGGHPNAARLSQTKHSDWMKMSHDADAPPMERLAAIVGLMTLSGSEKLMVNVGESQRTELPAEIKLDSIIKTTSQIITSCDDVITQGSSAWLLGNFYLSLNASPQSSTSVPASYSYLPETSLLRAIIDFLIQASKQGPEYISSEDVMVCLKALQEKVTGSLPPLNWTGVLSPIMKLPFNADVKLECIQLAIKQCTSSSSAILFVSSWCVPPLFNTLSEACQWTILSNCNILMKSITPATFQNFLEKSCLQAVAKRSQGKSLCLASLKGLNSALVVRDPPESTVLMLYKAVTKVFQELGSETETDILQLLSECLEHVPVQIFDDITNGDCSDSQSVIRGTFVRCYLVGAGKQPIAVLNSCIDAAFNIECDHERLLYYLSVCFYKMTQVDSTHTRVMQRVQWLLEIMGHIKNIVMDSYPVNLPKNRVIEFAINIVAACICTWTDRKSAAILDLNTSLLESPPIPKQWCNLEVDYNSCGNLMVLRPVAYVKSCIGNFEKEPWNQILPKVIDWLFTMMDLPSSVVSEEMKNTFRGCVHAVRSSPDYSKVAVWTRAVLME